ncbi:DUF6148 family protein [Orbus mooreae]|uniref:DUF6148 family protein n=1 Tax=Orbus mooreae TaxID=3074107 RepID=UPI00370D68FB
MSVDFSQMTPKARAKYLINEYTNAEIAVLSGAQSYTISGKSLTRANLVDIRNGRKYWEAELARLNGKSARRFRQLRVRDY